MIHGLRVVCLLILFAALGISSFGCGKKDNSPDASASKLTQANFDKIKSAMGEKEVLDILGSPSETKDVAGGKELTWKSGMSQVTVEIKDGKVASKMGAIVTVK